MPASKPYAMRSNRIARQLGLTVIAILVLSFNTSMACAQGKLAVGTVLQGNINFQDRTTEPIYSRDLPAVNQDIVDRLSVNNQWFRIPHWLAGRWRVEEQTEFYRLDYQSKAENKDSRRVSYRFQENWGSQLDRCGDIWHFSEQPNSNEVDLGEEKEVVSTFSCETISVGSDSVSLRLHSVVHRIDKKTQATLESTRVRCIQTYKPLTKNVFRVESIVYTNSMNGAPLSVSKRFWLATKIDSFEPIFTCNARSLIPLFYEYLAYNKLALLIPQ